MPDISVKASEFFADTQKRTRVFYQRVQLPPVPYNAGILHKQLDICLTVYGNLFRIKPGKSLAHGKILAVNTDAVVQNIA